MKAYVIKVIMEPILLTFVIFIFIFFAKSQFSNLVMQGEEGMEVGGSGEKAKVSYAFGKDANVKVMEAKLVVDLGSVGVESGVVVRNCMGMLCWKNG